MSDIVNKKIPRGKGWHNTGTTVAEANYGGAEYEGTIASFRDVDPTDKMSKRSAKDVVMILVRNVAAINLLPKQLVVWASGYEGKRVDGYAVSTELAVEVAGAVDERWPVAGVPVGELFWLAVKGPHLCKLPITAVDTIAAGARLVATTGTTSGVTTSGRVHSQVVTGSTNVLAKQIENKIGRAMSAFAASTNTGDADILVDLALY